LSCIVLDSRPAAAFVRVRGSQGIREIQATDFSDGTMAAKS